MRTQKSQLLAWQIRLVNTPFQTIGITEANIRGLTIAKKK